MSTVSNLLDSKGHDVLTILPDLPVFEALIQMTNYSVGTAVVMENGKVNGIVSERDVIHKVILQSLDPKEIEVRKIMSTELSVVAAETSIEDCMGLMTEKRIRHLPVLCGKKLCGIVSIGDVVKFLAVEQGFKIKNLETYICGSL